MAKTITIPLRVAQYINNAYLPNNPNKMRDPHPGVKKAMHIAAWCEEAHGISIDESVINWIMLGDDAVGEEPEAGTP